jgi:hypothetical protein
MEDTHFLYSTSMLEMLLQEFERLKETQSLDEVNKFTQYLIEHRNRYMTQYL